MKIVLVIFHFFLLWDFNQAIIISIEQLAEKPLCIKMQLIFFTAVGCFMLWGIVFVFVIVFSCNSLTSCKHFAQEDNLCSWYLDFCVSHLSQHPDNRETVYTVHCTLPSVLVYSNVLTFYRHVLYLYLCISWPNWKQWTSADLSVCICMQTCIVFVYLWDKVLNLYLYL